MARRDRGRGAPHHQDTDCQACLGRKKVRCTMCLGKGRVGEWTGSPKTCPTCKGDKMLRCGTCRGTGKREGT